MQDKYLNKAY